MVKPGRFVVVEGLEGAGKSTAIQTIKQCISPIAPHVILTREPGGTILGEKLRALIKETVDNEPIVPLSELLMMYASRVQLIEQVIKPALARGEWVISDRFELSTYAYQGFGRQLGTEVIDTLSLVCLQGFVPDLIVFLDVSLNQGFKRAKQRGKFDRIEQESDAFFHRVSEGYHAMLKPMENVCIVDANAGLEAVQCSIRQQIMSYIAHHEST